MISVDFRHLTTRFSLVISTTLVSFLIFFRFCALFLFTLARRVQTNQIGFDSFAVVLLEQSFL